MSTARLALAFALLSTPLAAQPAPTTRPGQPAQQTESDAYTRYELLAPGTAKFRILYEVTATTPGATAYFNPIRRGSIATDERVTDRATGKPLRFDVVSGSVARAGGVRGADTSGQYIRVTLARAVPDDGGEARVLIDKTYEDTSSYRTDGPEDIVFRRSLGIKRNTIVLPAGYELVACNYPSQILQTAGGRVAVSFWNATPAEAPLSLRARKVDRAGALAATPPASLGTGGVVPNARARLDERAYQNREIVYFLRPPETHSFALYHDYTETRPGESTYVNVVRAGSAVSEPSARNLDTGERLRWEVLAGDAIARRGFAAQAPNATPTTEIVVFRFAPVPAGGSTRLRMSETYTDSARYTMVGDTFVWDRALGRPANAVVLPIGWLLTNCSVPATVTELIDGRIRLDFINPRTDEIPVLITGRRRERER